MWWLVVPISIIAIPYVSRAVLIYEHNQRMIGALKMLTEKGGEMEWPVVRNYIQKITKELV